MARRSIIDEKGLGPRVLTLAAGGISHRKIAKLLADDGVKLSDVAIMNYLKANVEERKAATEQVKAAVQAELQREALSDVESLQELRDELRKMVFERPPQAIGQFGPLFTKDAGGKKVPVVDEPLKLRAIKEYRDTLALRVKIAGAGGDDDSKGVQVFLNMPEPKRGD